MKSTLSNLFIFAVGAVVGSVITWKLIKNKYEQTEAEEEVLDDFEEEDKTESDEDDSETIHYDYIRKYEKKEEKRMSGPYVIAPDELGEKDYEIVSLTYYTDGVLANDWDEVIDDIDEYVGLDSLNHFGKYEDDSVFVRNDEMKVDFEILLDTRRFEDVGGTNDYS